MNLHRLKAFHKCEKGQAMTEYAVAILALVPVAMYLFMPDNLILDGIRTLFDDIRFLVLLPGP
jgi:Flp pilus assembly pilin Flp